MLGCVLCGLIVLLVTALALYFIPAGRRALGDIRSLLRLLTGRAEVSVGENPAGVDRRRPHQGVLKACAALLDS